MIDKKHTEALRDRIQADKYLSEALARRPPNSEEIAWAKRNADNAQQAWDDAVSLSNKVTTEC